MCSTRVLVLPLLTSRAMTPDEIEVLAEAGVVFVDSVEFVVYMAILYGELRTNTADPQWRGSAQFIRHLSYLSDVRAILSLVSGPCNPCCTTHLIYAESLGSVASKSEQHSRTLSRCL